jgi:hypothetical protein
MYTFYTTVSRPTPGSTQPPVEREPGGSFPGDKPAGVEMSEPLPPRRLYTLMMCCLDRGETLRITDFLYSELLL